MLKQQDVNRDQAHTTGIQQGSSSNNRMSAGFKPEQYDVNMVHA